MTAWGRAIWTAIAAAAIGLALGGAAAAETAAEFFPGKTLRIVHAGGPAGSYAVYTRILANHLGEHIPGTPTIVEALIAENPATPAPVIDRFQAALGVKK